MEHELPRRLDEVEKELHALASVLRRCEDENLDADRLFDPLGRLFAAFAGLKYTAEFAARDLEIARRILECGREDRGGVEEADAG